jgi:hypothetical protein
MPKRWNRAVKAGLKSAGVIVAAFALVFAAGLTYSTTKGYTTWWFSLKGLVAVDGVRGGYMHRNREHSAVMITRTDSHVRQSYLVGIGGKHVIHCGEWHAPRFPAFPIGDVNPPCLFPNGCGSPGADNPVSSTLIARPGFVEFLTEKGSRVTASWNQ